MHGPCSLHPNRVLFSAAGLARLIPLLAVLRRTRMAARRETILARSHLDISDVRLSVPHTTSITTVPASAHVLLDSALSEARWLPKSPRCKEVLYVYVTVLAHLALSLSITLPLPLDLYTECVSLMTNQVYQPFHLGMGECRVTSHIASAMSIPCFPMRYRPMIALGT